ncbi:MAG TPA: HupU protein [Sulfurivirga caldicuralii]|nr:HupU protein [Sulfurivirga caldicuralii]
MNIVWLQSGGCSGCTMSLLCAEQPDLLSLSQLQGWRWRYFPSLSPQLPKGLPGLLAAVEQGEWSLDVLCLEGAVMTGPDESGAYHIAAGMDASMRDVLLRFIEQARYVVAVGSCAAFGGITAAGPNPGEAVGLQYAHHLSGGLLSATFRSRAGLPVINIAGCPVHPDWVTETLLLLQQDALDEADLDPLNRPRFYADKLVHHGCSRNEYYEYKASAEHLGELGCMMEHLGCMGTLAHADCNQRSWNGQGCCTDAGYPCIDCTAPTFGTRRHAYQETPKLGGIPVGLPTDMPKAWFIALSSLAKAATPERLKKNATAERPQLPPPVKEIKL